jgi:hypothetical protein
MENQTASIKNSLVAQVVEILGETYDFEVQPYAGNYRLIPAGLPLSNFKLELRASGSGVLLRAWAGPAANGQLACSRYADFYSECSTPEDWRAPEDVKKGKFPDTEVFGSASYLAGLATELIEWALLNVEITETAKTGVTFENTNFAGYGERDFMAAVIQIQKSGYASVISSVGSNLGFEYVVPSTNSRIDAVEFNEAGEVVTVIECQSGIQHGNYLDDEHFAKAISRYPQSAEIANTVKKIVIIAGGYSAEQLATFSQLPYDIVALATKVENGQIVLEKVN